jgi:hypothetical protein
MNNPASANRTLTLRSAALLGLGLFLLSLPGLAQPSPLRNTTLRRADSFFGLHFDFHAGPDCHEIGNNVTDEAITAIIRSVQPDFIQVDCKGHPGLSSYPTMVGNRAPGFIGDPLKLWRMATAREHVALYLHYSGIYDEQAMRSNPAWARSNADEPKDKAMASVFGPYVDRLLIPQLKELNDVYQADGVWVDGDCWATGIDHSPAAQAALAQATGITRYPECPDESGYEQLREFSRQAYKGYLRRYVDAVHAHAPGFQIASNWAYSSFMPEPVDIGVDFLSGDYNYTASLNSARWEGRCLQNQGKPWDLMTWGFVPKEGSHRYKSEIQLKQEAAAVISLGGGFQAYFTQNRDGSVLPWKVAPMVGVGQFVRERQPYCQYSTPEPQVALFFSKDDFYRRIPKLYGGWEYGDYIKGVLYALLDGQHSVQVLSEHHLRGKMSRCPLIVLPNMGHLDAGVKQELLDYAKQGGSLLVTGMRSTEFFKDDLNLAMDCDSEANTSFYLEFNHEHATINAWYQVVTLPDPALRRGSLVALSSPRSPAYAAGAVLPYGKGKVGFIFPDIGSHYFKGASSTLRNYMSAMVKELFPHPAVEVQGSHLIDVAVNRTAGKQVVNLVNLGGGHNSGIIDVYDEIPPLANIRVTIRADKKPTQILLLPEKQALPFTYAEGAARVIIPQIEIHSLLVID